MKRVFWSLLALASTFSVSSVASAGIDVGDMAPSMTPAKWVKGKPVAKFEKGKVYVVEFWATWCGPCLQSIPHLTELAKKFKGKVNFTGVSVWENQTSPEDDAYFKKVDAFVKEMGPKMDYNVAVDGLDKSMAKNWMEAAGERGIPSAFVIDQKGRVAWIGHPLADLEKTLSQVLAGTYDMAPVKRARAEEKAAEAKERAVYAPIQAALANKDYKLALSEIDKAVAANPDLKPRFAMTRVDLTLRTDEAAGLLAAKALANDPVIKKDPNALNALAWNLATFKYVGPTDYKVAVAIAKQAVDAGAGNDPAVLDTYAYALFKSGDKATAIKTQEKAIELAKKSNPALVKELEGRLAEFKKTS